MDYEMKARELLDQMTLEEKAGLCTGSEFYRMQGVERLGLPAEFTEDGPNGLRKQATSADHLGLGESIPATCFPTASCSACSFDREALQRMGVALGEECRANNVGVLLGPGVNMKRSPLCGRNFEYFSEDPYLAGEMGVAWVDGVQSQNVGTSLKHFAANSQERLRMVSESVVDERALHEIYLSAFEQVVRQAKPWTVMASYNKLRAAGGQGDGSLEGRHACDNEALLNGILRDRWDFDGVVVSDWGGEANRLQGMAAGLDLEMPYVSPENTNILVEAVRNGELDEDCLDTAALHVTELILKCMQRTPTTLDEGEHHEVAREIAREGAVLLKNEDGLLPLDPGAEVELIGALARTPRYQGAGSSRINPIKLENACDEFAAADLSFDFAEGYHLDNEDTDEVLLQEACEEAKGKDAVVIFAGLPDSFESEGWDRSDMRVPANQVELIERVAEVNPNVVVVLAVGAPVDMAWEGSARSILLSYLGGEAAAGAATDLICGKACPSGKLAETWPLRLEDNPSYDNYAKQARTSEYRESIFVGYRWYDSARKEVRYPFGFGLSYTTFEYSGLRVSRDTLSDGGRMVVSVDITNTGNVAGAEVAQLYVALKVPGLFTAEQELKGFERVELQPGETRVVDFVLDERSFSYYNTDVHEWCLAEGEQGIRVGSSSRHVRLHTVVMVGAQDPVPAPNFQESAPGYYKLAETGQLPQDTSEFEALYGSELPAAQRAEGEPFNQDSTLGEMQTAFIGRLLRKGVSSQMKKMSGGDEATLSIMTATAMEFPIRSLIQFGGDTFNTARVEAILTMANGHLWKGLLEWIGGGSKPASH